MFVAFTAFVAFLRCSSWSFYFIYLVILLWCGVACSVYGSLVWDPYGIHSVCSVYQALAARFLWRLECFVTFIGHWGGTLVVFTVLVVFTGHWGWTFMVFFSVCSV